MVKIRDADDFRIYGLENHDVLSTRPPERGLRRRDLLSFGSYRPLNVIVVIFSLLVVLLSVTASVASMTIFNCAC